MRCSARLWFFVMPEMKQMSEIRQWDLLALPIFGVDDLWNGSLTGTTVFFFSGEKKWWRKYNHDKPIDSLVKYIRISEHLSRHEISLGRRANVCSHYMWFDLLYFSWGSLFIRPNHEIPLACNATITVKLRENKGRSISRKLPRKNWYTFEMSP